ncbi:hypothetical protein JWG42_04765 [Desulfoprunum benzoelyticum]|uniref:Uncharacterized protein n=1 Tax=Desulfoprunum benzoelyticum TaxID=1506996 RepID=A0A840UU05_9BACT|nr:hypothetical protein [Desulfoprunum benzoelyticum]MBB5346874.1 hypothetical protein [Desulfoprunum benzoelyticum]MBM9529464.1 hypothetical protein [Desulfoprunum benzoelyticum]
MALFAAIINILMDCTDSGAEKKEKYAVPCDAGQKKIILLNGISITPAIDDDKGGVPC